MYSTLTTSGIAVSFFSSVSTWNAETLSNSLASTLTFDSVNSSPASRPVWMIQNPASRRSMRTIVAVAAMLMTALRQNPCQARLRLNATNEIMSVHPVVCATDLIANDVTLFERDDALAERRDD